MKILPTPTPITAREYAIQQFQIFGELRGREAGQAKISHCEYVGVAAEQLVRLKRIKHRLKYGPDMGIVHTGGWLHDVGYARQAEKQDRREAEIKGHAEYSLEMCKETFSIGPILEDCIINHGRREHPVTREGRILQLSDRLSYILMDPKDFIVLALVTKGMSQDEAGDLYARKISGDFAAYFQNDSEFQEIAHKLMQTKRQERRIL